MCFREYTSSLKWCDILVKMLNGLFAYKPDRTCYLTSECNVSLQQALVNIEKFNFVGIAEMWELSLLVLHHKLPQFRYIYEFS